MNEVTALFVVGLYYTYVYNRSGVNVLTLVFNTIYLTNLSFNCIVSFRLQEIYSSRAVKVLLHPDFIFKVYQRFKEYSKA